MSFDELDISQGSNADLQPDYSGLEVDDDFELDLSADLSGEYEELRGKSHVVERRLDSRRVPLMVVGGICAVVAALCVGMLVYVLFLHPSGGSRVLGGTGDDAGRLSDNRAEVLLPVYVPDLDSRGSRIPVSIGGTLADGSAYAKDTYVSYDGNGLRLEPGTYELRVSGSPISAAGTLYAVPGTAIAIVVGEGLEVSLDPSSSMIFSALDALSVTDEQIEAARALIKKDPERTMYADTLAERAKTRREEARAGAQSSQNQRATEEAAAAAAVEQMRATQGEEGTAYQGNDSTSEPSEGTGSQDTPSSQQDSDPSGTQGGGTQGGDSPSPDTPSPGGTEDPTPDDPGTGGGDTPTDPQEPSDPSGSFAPVSGYDSAESVAEADA